MLSGEKIREEINRSIFIEPFDETRLNSNSYNLSLSNKIKKYDDYVLDMKRCHTMTEIIIPDEGYILQPHILYLGSTVERTNTNKFIPMIEGRSSIARLGLFVHITAGLGEAGFDGHWTLEMVCTQPLRIYPNTQICQIFFHEITGSPLLCMSQKYQNSVEAMPSLLYREMGEANVKC